VDEADELIATDAVQHIHAIYGRLVAASHGASRFDRLQVCFLSATLDTPEVRQLAGEICHEPFWINLRGGGNGGDSVFPDTVHHCVVHVSPDAFDGSAFVKSDAVHRRGKLDRAVSLDGLSKDEANSEKIKQLKFKAVLAVLDAISMDQVLIFCRTNLDCDLMEMYLKSQVAGGLADKYSCRVLAGMRAMQDRQKALEDFKGGESRILIATDVAARGIDIRELPFVINVTLPSSSATYVHRCGRVGRADRMGLAISLVASVKEKVWFCQAGKKPPCDDTRDYKNGGTTVSAPNWVGMTPGFFSDFLYVHRELHLVRRACSLGGD
jgi:ATP-dependent RNA helicase DDX1